MILVSKECLHGFLFFSLFFSTKMPGLQSSKAMGRTENISSLSIILIQQKIYNAHLKISENAKILVSKKYLHGFLNFSLFFSTKMPGLLSSKAMGRTANIPSLSIIHIQQNIYNAHLKIYKNAMILLSKEFLHDFLFFFCPFFLHKKAWTSQF